jgi:AcrR family transcriptional regulator
MGSDESAHAGYSQEAPLPRALVPVSQRERLLDGMAQTVARRGYAATSVADVLRAARISRRTFYEQFADKEDCFLAAYDEIVALCSARVAAAYHAADTWENGIARALEALLHVLAAEPDFAHLGIVDVLAVGPRGLARREQTLQRFTRFIDASREDTETVVAPPELVAQAIVGGIHELVYTTIVRDDARRLPALADDLLHYTLMLFGAPAHPA